MRETPRHSVSVAGIVVNQNDEVLVIQREDNSHWEPPGGVLELGESPYEGVAREVLEETGVKVEPGRLTGVYKNMNRGIVALVFRCTPIGGEVALSPESKAVQWLPVESVKQLMAPTYSVRVLDAFGDDVQVRAHDGGNTIYDDDELRASE